MLSFVNTTYLGFENIARKSVYTSLSKDLALKADEQNLTTLAKNAKFSKDEESSFKNTIHFTDFVSNTKISLKISDENLSNLKAKFAGNISLQEDGSYILKKEAESIASGWFADIAYKRGYLKADANNDGKLSDEERKNIYSYYGNGGFYSTSGGNVATVMATEAYSYLRAEEDFRDFTSKSLEEEFNKTLEKDSDFNGEILYGEMMSKGQMIAQAQSYIQNEGYTPPTFLEDMMDQFDQLNKKMLKDLKKLLEEKRLEQEALEKAKKELEKTAEIDIKHSNDQSLDKNLEKIENLKSQNPESQSFKQSLNLKEFSQAYMQSFKVDLKKELILETLKKQNDINYPLDMSKTKIDLKI
ncbi:hypothetical protein DMB92_05190 [Campylobacter sp. MIT 99-7217]|uniref:hypothetical protein n=1 Tax=Campylobacter sp. MIT 99-7217 TaxID=535091 RepID=UPI0011576226|nr:hypothetical protein [Campylobacter sp. MIT 99-7217]TQR32492.1 hypothetical protein DMB92_05190 [Campylobacter sp. MIT 99-7217]